MASFDLNTLNSALENSGQIVSGVDFSGKSLKLDSANDAAPIVDAINSCPNLQYLTLTGNTLGVTAAQAIAKALENRPELKVARFSDMFTGRMKTEIPPALSALGDGMIAAGARLSVLDLSDNAFGPIGVEGLAKLLQSDVCSQLEELRLNNNGLGITGGKLLAGALAARPRRLKIFVAGRNRLENEGAKALADVFKSMGSLEEISMPQNGIYHKGVSALSEAFKHNPRLSRLNLNDNTVGGKGAEAIAAALPNLPNLKAINFGDCLLKSKGAIALATALQTNGIKVECIDLSHNEMGREACLHVAAALTAQPDSQATLARVVLAGNSLGGAANKKLMRDKLGPCAELSDGEGSDEEYVTDSESDKSESENSEDSATEDAQHADTADVIQLVLDTSGVNEVESDVERFLREPVACNLDKLGTNVADVIDTHLQAIKEPSEFTKAYVEALLLVSGVRATCARAMFSRLVQYNVMRRGEQWTLTDVVLAALCLIKSENKCYKIRWSLTESYKMLATIIDEPYFPNALRDTLRFFISSKLATMPEELREVIEQHPNLYLS